MMAREKLYEGGRKGDNGNKYHRPSLKEHEEVKKKAWIRSSLVTILGGAIILVLISVVTGINVDINPLTGSIKTTNPEEAPVEAIEDTIEEVRDNREALIEHLDDYKQFRLLVKERNANVSNQIAALKDSFEEFRDYQKDQNNLIIEAIKSVKPGE